VVVSEGVEYVELVCPGIPVPPVAAVYQMYCPFVPPDAVNVTEEFIQPAALVVVGAEGRGLIVAVTGVRVLSHVPLVMLT